MSRGIRDAAIALILSLTLGAALPAAAVADEGSDLDAALSDGQEAPLVVGQTTGTPDTLVEEESDSEQAAEETDPNPSEQETDKAASGSTSDGDTEVAPEETPADNDVISGESSEEQSPVVEADLQIGDSSKLLGVSSTEEVPEAEPDEEPVVPQPGWEVVDGETYYRDEACERVVGLQNIDGALYYFDPSTRAAKELWQEIDGKTYYFDPTTHRAARFSKTLVGTDGKEHFYYFNSLGAMLTGWLTWPGDGTKTFFAENANYIPKGAAFTKWVITGGKTYYFNPTNYRAARYRNKLPGRDGVSRNYYFSGAGAMQTGLITFSDGKSYYNPSAGAAYGAAVTGWMTISGKTYFFQTHNQLAAVYAKNGLIGKDGKPHDYYFNGAGIMAVGAVNFGNTAYLYGVDGAKVVAEGWYTINNDDYYVKNQSPVRYRQTNLLGKDGKKHNYYFDGSFKLYRGWIYFSASKTWACYDETTGVETSLLQVEIGADKIRIIEEYLSWATDIANDESHGYSQYTRWGPDYDCSSLVISALRAAGCATGSASYTGDMRSNLTARGWVWMTDFSKIRRGDILLNEQTHTAFYLGNGKQLAARIAETGGIHGRTGDQTGREICIHDYVASNWHDGFLRLV